MSRVICVAGESGSGKTTSCRNLDPATTFYFDCDRKGLSWRGWKKQYNAEAKNYCATSNAAAIMSMLDQISKHAKYKAVVIDTINAIMIDDEMANIKNKGYEKWTDLAASIYNLVSHALTLREDLTVIFLAHTQTERDDSGYMFTRIKTNGRKLEKIVLESKFTTVLIAKSLPDGRYIFETQGRNSTAKTPLAAFSDFEIENDITKVITALEEY